ncbi:hypothetical protein ACHAWO_003486 [Cyclotella atomus]|uniref:Uncharacterized protein n=1 Tax=Cyclotella atomus TaxID=382360 RepID=A0ABD3PJC4_9STRA
MQQRRSVHVVEKMGGGNGHLSYDKEGKAPHHVTTGKLSQMTLLGAAFVIVIQGILIVNFYTSGYGSGSGFANQPQRKYVHDDPAHPWHWVRENPPDPDIGKKRDCDGRLYEEMYDYFQREGWIIFRSCSLQLDEERVLDPVAEFTKSIEGDRIVNAPNKQVRELAVDPDTLEFIEYIHGGRRTFPYQTLNFPKGTQQRLHSDLVHFDSQPRALMTAAWVALEDMNENNGPLRFFPKSHQWGTWDYDEVGLHYKYDTMRDQAKDQENYGYELEDAMMKAGLAEANASEMKRGQTFIWAAALVHGGSKQKDLSLSRLSQVTHYFFEGTDYLWQPRTSQITSGKVTYIHLVKPPCKRQFLGEGGGSEPIFSCADGEIASFKNNWKAEF